MVNAAAGKDRLYRIPGKVYAKAIAIGLGQVATLVAYIFLLRLIVDGLAPATVGAAADLQWRWALIQAGLLGLVALLHGWLRAAGFNVAETAGYEAVRVLRMKMYGHLQGMTPRQFQHRARGGLLLRFLGDLSMTRLWISRGVLSGIIAAIVMVGALAVLFFFSVWMSLAIVVTVAVGAAASFLAGQRMRQATRVMRRRRSLVMSNIDEQLNAQPVVQVFGRSAGEYSRLSHQNDELTRALVRVARLRGYLRGVSTAFALLALGAVLTVGLFEVRRGTATIGTVVGFVVVTRQLSGPVRTLGLAHDYWHRAQVSVGKIKEYLRSSTRDLDSGGHAPLRVRKGSINFMSVSVQGALSEVDLQVAPGDVVAITGEGGSGKSTLLGLVSRTVDPDGGCVIIDGQMLSKTALRSASRWIGAAGPELPLMRGSLWRNITYASPRASEEEVERVLSATGLDEMLLDLPYGLQTWVTEGGLNLSYSQRQRIALARALVGNPPILLLDEPTLGLDQKAKADFAAILARYDGTVLIATQDPREIAMANTVVVLKGGAVAEVMYGEEYRDREWLESNLSGEHRLYGNQESGA
ncbi:ABC transporter ATP-binding protein [Pseudarthrobacter sp. NIBRBAC000502770]|uniref:ABC transporter ATP-binding protein n=1 Tax=Pseudarthrobacter sp. NIBRBAC000502770 TaxID=2590785 RepID=UPI0011404034|nr:ABC transporter ATP-binding protein [Pseudarthrobacter sp. NIBRBAC000502770]QDG89382.1 ABC transporter ATP-binding protein [Pseudarthrobacter sp. NIBRBAC000502770]